MRLIQCRAETSDFEEMAPLAFRAFKGDPMTPVFFGPECPENLVHLQKGWVKGTKESSDIWMKVIDLDGEGFDSERTNCAKEVATVRRKRIVGACNWRIYPTFIPPKEEEKKPIDEEYAYLPTHQQRLDASHMLTDYFGFRQTEIAEPHVLCSLLFVDPEYHRKGIGKMLMQFGHEVADSLMLPVWLEASVKGEGLYRALGFEETSRKEWETESFGRCSCLRMRRGASVKRWEWKGKGEDLKKM